MIKRILFLTFLGSFNLGYTQEWVDKMNDVKVNFYEVQKAFNDYYKEKEKEKEGPGYKQFKRWENFMSPRVYPTGERIDVTIASEELKKFSKQTNNSPQHKSANWTSLGKNSWTSRSYNPGNGRINSVRVDPTNANTIYVGTPGGGLWKSIDGGSSWNAMSDDLPVLGVSDIVINPLNPSTVYIATGDGFSGDTYGIGVLVSHDGGSTWNTTNLINYRSQNVLCRRMAMNPQDTNVLIVATSTGLFKTNDAGTSWSTVLSGNVRNVKYKPNDSSIVYASTDQFYRSIDGGNSFSIVTTGISSAGSINRMEIAVSQAAPNYVYAIAGKQSDASFEGLYLSINSGQSFARMSNSPNILAGASDGTGTGGQSWYDLAIAVSQINANEVYVGGINVWKSTNSGLNWTIMSHWVYPSTIGYTHADIHSLEWYNGKIYCGSDGGVFYSSNSGNNWNNISTGLSIGQYYKMAQTEQNANVLMSGAQDNGCDYRDNTGNWYHVLGGDGMNVEIDPTNFNIIYYSWQNGGIQRSYDGGVSRTGINGSIRNQENGAWVTPFQIDPNNSLTLYAGFENVWKTTNRGTSWTKISNFSGGATLRQLKVAPSNSNVIYVCTNDNNIRRTTNGGSNWSSINTGLPNRVISDIEVHPLYEDSLWISFSGYFTGSKVFVSGNGGQNWTNLSTNMPNLPVNDLAYDTLTEVLYAATDVGIYYQDRTVNLGWNAYNQGLPNVQVNEIEIHRSAQKLRAATYGRGMWEADLINKNITTRLQDNEYPEGIHLSPNPSKGIVNISWKNNSPEIFRLYDLSGKLLIEKRPNDLLSIDLDLSHLPKGLYLLESIEGQRGQVFKVIRD